MQCLPVASRKSTLIVWSAFLISWVALGLRLLVPYDRLNIVGPFIWLEMLFLLLLYGNVLLAAYGLGHLFLRLFDLSLSKAESTLLAILIGLAMFSMGLTIIGLIGWLNTVWILVWLALSGLIALREVLAAANNNVLENDKPVSSYRRSYFEVLLQTFILVSIPLLFINLVAPVWDYDALLYHLDVPRRFLAEGRIHFDSEIWRSAYPYLGEMPFTVGLVFGLDSLGKLINFTYAVLFISSIYIFCLRFIGRQVAITAVAILIGAPAFLLWATWAAVDFAWASYEFWSIYAISLWLTGDDRMSTKWLVLAGIMSGCAASIKYLSFPVLLMVAVIVLWKSVANTQQFKSKSISNLIIFGSSAALVMGVWYVRNWLSTGNPIYPLVFGGPGWEPLENQALNDYVQTFGVGKAWLDYLLLPFNVYVHHDRFATIPIEIIHPALWLSVFYPFIGKSNKTIDIIPVYVLLSFISWVVTSQVIRFLIPLSAFAAILAGSVIEKSPSVLRNFLKFGLLGGFMILGLIHQITTIQGTGVWRYFIGQESAAQTLQRINNDFSTITYIQNSLAAEDRVLFLWDGRGYYCDQRCISDDEQSTAIRLSIDSRAPQTLARDLDNMGITHLMLSSPDASWFMAYHDPRRLHRNAFDYFTEVFLPDCGKSVFQDRGMELFEITCH